MDTNLYLERLKIDKNINFNNNYELLKELQFKHVTNIPYENLDIINNTPLNLDTNYLFEKIIKNSRGGYCFEVNGLFGALLEELGFKVTNLAARFLRGETELPLRRHRVLLVNCEGQDYICDVGIGSAAPKYPLKLIEGVLQQQFSETYKLEKDDFLGWVIYELHNNEWRKFYSFTLEPQIEVDFIAPSFYCEKHPNSIFNKDIMVSIKTADGRKTLNGNEYKAFRGDDIVLIKENLTKNEILNLLDVEFNIKNVNL